mmetsp:Transcript_48482/g.154866  ORF Transcript_48482/g.154866 Transcript_48482/m.154866 type:complete len:234 (-) Transcript_48482:279-980(-)
MTARRPRQRRGRAAIAPAPSSSSRTPSLRPVSSRIPGCAASSVSGRCAPAPRRGRAPWGPLQADLHTAVLTWLLLPHGSSYRRRARLRLRQRPWRRRQRRGRAPASSRRRSLRCCPRRAWPLPLWWQPWSSGHRPRKAWPLACRWRPRPRPWRSLCPAGREARSRAPCCGWPTLWSGPAPAGRARRRGVQRRCRARARRSTTSASAGRALLHTRRVAVAAGTAASATFAGRMP